MSVSQLKSFAPFEIDWSKISQRAFWLLLLPFLTWAADVTEEQQFILHISSKLSNLLKQIWKTFLYFIEALEDEGWFIPSLNCVS